MDRLTKEHMGWTVLRFLGKDIKKDVNQCVSVIEETIFEKFINEEDILDLKEIG